MAIFKEQNNLYLNTFYLFKMTQLTKPLTVLIELFNHAWRHIKNVL